MQYPEGKARNWLNAVFIDSRNKEVRAVKQRPCTLQHRLGCRRVMVAPFLNGNEHGLMVLLASGDKGRRTYGFNLAGSPFPVNGYGILFGIDVDTKELLDAPFPEEWVRERVEFF